MSREADRIELYVDEGVARKLDGEARDLDAARYPALYALAMAVQMARLGPEARERVLEAMGAVG